VSVLPKLICKRFENQDAIVIYMPDHGEECYEENRGFICRNHSASIDWPLAHYEFEIPFWIYCSPKYAHSRPEIFKEIVQARKRRFMTDALPDMLLYLAGISSKDYHEEYNILSSKYDEMRPRILKATTDYDKLRDAYIKNKKKK
jgi:heptose-I-phosphate ethanolaminephosphotransferase